MTRDTVDTLVDWLITLTFLMGTNVAVDCACHTSTPVYTTNILCLTGKLEFSTPARLVADWTNKIISWNVPAQQVAAKLCSTCSTKVWNNEP